MTRLLVLDYPLEPIPQITWLEELLMSLELGDFATQQQMLLDEAVGHRTAEQICNTEIAALYESGIAVLSPAQRAELLHTPRALLQLQELILLHGGPYWQQVRLPIDQQHELQQATQQTNEQLLEKSTAIQNKTAFQWSKNKLVAAILSIAAVVMLAVFLNRGPSELAWSKPDVLQVALQGQAFKQHLAISGHELLADLPADKRGLTTRLQQTLLACDALLAAELLQLEPAVRQDLKDRCQRWRTEFAQQLANLESGQKTLVETKTEFTALGQKMLAFLAS